MIERHVKWWTPYLSREFELLVFGDGRGLPLILFPTSFGRHSQNKDFGLIDAVAGHIDAPLTKPAFNAARDSTNIYEWTRRPGGYRALPGRRDQDHGRGLRRQTRQQHWSFDSR